MVYQGSKRRIAKKLLEIFNKVLKTNQTYIEPFCGGCNMIEHIQNRPRIANDINPYVIELFKGFLNGFEPFEFDRNFYNYVKNNKEFFDAFTLGYVGFIGSYAGKFFGGYFDNIVTDSRKRSYFFERFRNLQKQVENLKDVKFLNCEYFDIEYPPNSFIYCDPPYENTSKYSTDFNHELFWEWVRTMVKNGHNVFVSEYKAPNDFKQIFEIELNCDIKSTECLTRVEKLFVHESQFEFVTNKTISKNFNIF
jgi:DNA adenine methylase